MPDHPLYVTSFRGIGPVTLRELRRFIGVDASATSHHSLRDYDITRFTSDRVEDLDGLRTTEDVFYEIGLADLTGHRADAARVADIVVAGAIENAIGCKRSLTPKARPGHPTFRVIVQAEDAPWRTYRRDKLEEAAVQAITGRYRKWKRVEDNSHIEIWIQLIGREALVGVRLTDRRMRHRDYKTANLPGSLRPTIAAAAVQLSKPTNTDVFLDPSCGAGTIMIERALECPYQMLMGGDIREEAVQAAHENFGNRHKPWDIRVWDATSLPLEDGSVNRIVNNPPWGKQIQTGQDLPEYYKRSLSEIQRVLLPWGRSVFLTSEWRQLNNALERCPALRVDEHIRDISVMGRKADLFCLIRTNK